MVESENERWSDIEDLVTLVRETDRLYEDENLRIFPMSQGKLWPEGYDKQGRRYVGSKWGKYIRAPDIFYRVLEKGENLFIPLKELAEVRFGIKTGANEFFYLTSENIDRLGIEREFVQDIIKSPRECNSISIDMKESKYKILMVHKNKEDLRGTNALRYIEWGEGYTDPADTRNIYPFFKKPTCASRKRWYDVGQQRPAHLLWFKAFNDRFLVPVNKSKILNSDRFYSIYLQENQRKHVEIVGALLNTTLQYLFIELFGRVNLGEGALNL